MTPGSCSTGIHILLETLELPFEAWIINIPAGEHLRPGWRRRQARLAKTAHPDAGGSNEHTVASPRRATLCSNNSKAPRRLESPGPRHSDACRLPCRTIEKC